MSRRRQLNLWTLIFLVASIAVIFLVSCGLRSGYAGLGDGQLFVFRDGLLLFSLIIIGLFVATFVYCIYSFQLPVFDYLSRIVFVNIASYSAIGLLMYLFRIPLYSGSLLLTELVVSTLLLLIYFYFRNRLYPVRIGLVSENLRHAQDIKAIKSVSWVTLEPDTLIETELDVVLADLQSVVDEKLSRQLTKLSQLGVIVLDRSYTESLLTGKIWMENISLNEFGDITVPKLYLGLKFVTDILITLLLLPFILVVSVLVALAIKVDSPGPILFSQHRIGYKNKPFLMFKFRSMHSASQNADAEFAPQADQRITRIGRILRRNRLDEVPQFWNVLKGEMSIVGPRPEQSQFVDRFSKTIPFYDLRHTVRPGITGWAQVMTGYASNEDQTRTKLEYDFFYIKHLNIWVDMLVLIRTFKTVLLGRGSQ